MAYRSSTAASGDSTTPSTTVPASVAANDIVILVVCVDSAAVDFTGKYPSGFTELADVDITLDGQSAAVAWKRLTGADAGSYTCSAMGVSAGWNCAAFAFSGRDTGNPPTLSSSVNNSGNTSPITITATTVTALAGDDLLWVSTPDVHAAFVGNGHTPPAGYTERQDVEEPASGWSNLSGATLDNAGAGATGSVSGTFTITSSTAGYAAFLVRIPASGGGGGTTVKQLAALGVG